MITFVVQSATMKSITSMLCFCREQCLGCFLFLYFFFSALSPAAQVNNNGNLFIAGNIYVKGDFSNATTAAYQNNGNFNLAGNFLNDQAAMAEGTGTTLFMGASRQEIAGSQPSVFHHVNYDNASGVLMKRDVIIGGIISPVSGSLYFNDHTLTMKDRVNTASNNPAAFNVTPASNLVVTGNAAAGKALYFDVAGNTLHDLTLSDNATAILGNALNITAGNGFGTVTVNPGANLDAAGFLTLKSDSLGTARVGISEGTIQNEVTVERFFPAIAAWRFIGIPFSSSSQTINQAWQEGNTDVILSCPPQHPGIPGYGTAITWNNVAPGYDVHNTTNTSLQVYQNNLWITPASTFSNLVTTSPSAFPAYVLFVRGDRSVCLTQISKPNITTLRPRGVLNQFNGTSITRSLSAAPDNYVFVGNPYASSVDIKKIISNGSGIHTDRFWIWNPLLGGTKGVGGYVAFSLIGDVFVPNDTSYKSGTIIQSSQAFMVQRDENGTEGSLTFSETDKSSIQTVDGNFGMNAAQSLKPPAVFINLLNTDRVIMDGVGVVFNKQFAGAVDSVDVPKRWNEDIENLALIRDSKPLAIELRPVPVFDDTLFLRMYLRQQPYVLQVFSRNVPAGLRGKAWIVDKYLSVETEINLYDTVLHSFTINTDTNSYRNRFMLVFKRVKDNSNKPYALNKIATSIYPNPATGNAFNLVLQNLVKGDYTVNIYTTSGVLATKLDLAYAHDQKVYPIKLPATIAAGNYVVQVVNDKGVIMSAIPLIVAQ